MEGVCKGLVLTWKIVNVSDKLHVWVGLVGCTEALPASDPFHVDKVYRSEKSKVCEIGIGLNDSRAMLAGEGATFVEESDGREVSGLSLVLCPHEVEDASMPVAIPRRFDSATMDPHERGPGGLGALRVR